MSDNKIKCNAQIRSLEGLHTCTLEKGHEFHHQEWGKLSVPNISWSNKEKEKPESLHTIKCAYCWKEGEKDSFDCFNDMTHTCKHCGQVSELELEIMHGGTIFNAIRGYE